MNQKIKTSLPLSSIQVLIGIGLDGILLLTVSSLSPFFLSLLWDFFFFGFIWQERN